MKICCRAHIDDVTEWGESLDHLLECKSKNTFSSTEAQFIRSVCVGGVDWISGGGGVPGVLLESVGVQSRNSQGSPIERSGFLPSCPPIDAVLK